MRRRIEENDPAFFSRVQYTDERDYADDVGVHNWNNYNFEHKSASNIPRNGTQNKHFQKRNHCLDLEWKK